MKHLFVLLLLVGLAQASKTTLTGSITDAQGSGINGTLVMTLPVPAQDTSTLTAVAPGPVLFRLVNGSITGGAQLYDVANLQPAGLYYQARGYDTSGNLQFYGNYIVTGGTFNLGAATPTVVTTSNISYSGVFFSSLNNTLTGNNYFSGNNTFTNINTTLLYVDGIKYPTVQSAINALPSGGGTVLLQCNTTYVGPSVFTFGAVLQSLCPHDYTTILTYSAAQTIGPVNGIGIEGIALDFRSGSGGLILDGIQGSHFDMNVYCSTATICVQGSASTQNAVFNRFDYLNILTAGATGLHFAGSGPVYTGFGFTDNDFRTLVVNMSRSSPGAITESIGFGLNCDSNHFFTTHLFFNNNVTSGNGIVFNDTGTPAVDQDANAEFFNVVDVTAAGAITGAAFTVNKSLGNQWQEGFGISFFTTLVAADAASPYLRNIVIGGITNSSEYSTVRACASVGTAANPSVNQCAGDSGGHFSCATAATGGTCTVNTTAVTPGSSIFVFESDNAATGTALGVTCNTSTNVLPASRLLASQTSATGFTINLGTVTTNPACFSYFIIN